MKIVRSCVIAGTMALTASAALAADEAPAAEGEIIVTAQLRKQNLIDVPIALTAYSGDFLEKIGVGEFDRLGQFVPGFDVQNQSPNNPGFVMRGITSDSGTAFNEPRVSVFQDGVSISKSRGSYVELFDVERVEIAKGPQSTLYGRGALIGAVNIIQNKADLSGLSASARGSYGNFNGYLAEAIVNVPINEAIAVRVAGRIKKRDGTVPNLLDGNDFNSQDTRAIRASAHMENELITLDLIGNYQKDTPDGTPFKSIAYRPTDPTTGAVLGNTKRTSGAALAPGPNFEDGKPLGLNRRVWGATALAAFHLNDNLTLDSVSGFRRFDSLEVFDADGIGLPLLTASEHAHGKQASQELRLTFDNKGPLTAFIGTSYVWENGSQATPAQFDERVTLARLTNTLSGLIPGRPGTDPAPLAAFANTAFTGALLQAVAGQSGVALSTAQARAIAANLKPAHLETSANFSRTRSVDVFGDVTYKIGEKFELGAGLRYSHDDKTSGVSSAVLNGRSVLGGFIGALSQPAATRAALLGALAVPGAANIPLSAGYPVPLFGLAAQPTAGNGSRTDQGLKDDGFTYRATARYAPTQDSSLYATYSRGRRPEVLSALPPSAPFGPVRFNRLPSETVDSYEVGAKAALMNRTLFLDGSLFFYQYNDFQTTEQQGTIFVTTNAGKAESYGFEGQARWLASDMVSLFATYAFNHSRFKTGLRDGNRFRLSPDHSASIGATLGVPAFGGKVELTPTATYQSKVFFDDDNDLPALQQPPAALIADNIQDEFQKAFVLVNARLAYTPGNGAFRVELFADNVLDKRYIKDAGNTGDGLGMPTFIAGEPRLYGISATVRFGGRPL